MNVKTRPGWQLLTYVAFLVVFAGAFFGCDSKTESNTAQTSAGSSPAPAPPPLPPNAIEVVFAYGSEKQNWIDAETAAFHQTNPQVDGRPVRIKPMPMGSGETIDMLLEGGLQAHLVSPASGVFITLGNARSRAKSAGDLVGPTENLVLSPVVIAMWKPMADAIGNGQKAVGWSDVLALATDANGWASHGHGEWGQFRFGHTHPLYSNSGLISVLAEVYAASGKVAGLTLDDVNSAKTADFVQKIEGAVVHYGSSTGFFGRKMFGNGPEYLSAAVLYENMVIEANSAQQKPILPVVAIYPKEGTFWSDHPVGVVQRPWVTDEHKKAAKLYTTFLLASEQQKHAMDYGFRPADPAIPLSGTFSAENGVDPKQPSTTLEVPPAEVVEQVVQVWKKNKKHSDIALVFDTSGSMRENNRIVAARQGAVELLQLLGDEDRLTLVPFSSDIRFAGKSMSLATDRQKSQSAIEGLFPGGGTKLYDAIVAAHRYVAENPDPKRIQAIVVLTDGADTESSTRLEQLISQVRFDSEKRNIRIFTIGYDSGAKADVLGKIADESQGKFYKGTPENIREVFKDIATFF
jgi:Ca-activated chloride channel family protein